MCTLVTDGMCSTSSLSQPLKLSHFKTVAAGMLGFQLCQFNTGRYNNGYVRGCVIHHHLKFFCFSLIHKYPACHRWQIFHIVTVTYSVMNYRIRSQQAIYYTVTLLPTDRTCYYSQNYCCNYSSYCQFSYSSIGYTTVALLDQKKKKTYMQINHVV